VEIITNHSCSLGIKEILLDFVYVGDGDFNTVGELNLGIADCRLRVLGVTGGDRAGIADCRLRVLGVTSEDLISIFL